MSAGQLSIFGENHSLDSILKSEQELAFKKKQVLDKALLNPDSFDELYHARQYMQSIEPRQDVPIKSIIFDPLLLSAQNYKEKNYTLNYDILRNMSSVHLIKSIIGTRKNQFLSFCTPQPNKYSTGFVIKKKERLFGSKKQTKLTKQNEKEIEYLTNFILNCGDTGNIWHGHSFDDFVKMWMDDSLTLDQATFEVVRDLQGRPVEFFATDGATFRLAKNKDESELYGATDVIAGYPPAYVQIYQGQVLEEFYPWELCFGIRNSSTNIYRNGYGRSELEDMVKTVTSILNADQYNGNFFKIGSNPRGILSYKGNMNPASLNELKQHWTATMAGVQNMHKIAALNADQVNWVSTHEANKDMEFSKYYEFLIKIVCAQYLIDPSEIGFPMSGSAESKPMFEGNNEGRLKYSKDKGLKPLLGWGQGKINKYIIEPLSAFLSDEYYFEFVGIEEKDEETELDRAVKEVANIKTLNEVREERDLSPIKGGDVILNSVFLQQQQMAMMGSQDSNNQMDDEFGPTKMEQDNPFTLYQEEDEEKNPFQKALTNYLEKSFTNQ